MGRWQWQQRGRDGDGTGDGDGGTFGQTTSQRPGTDWIRNRNRSWKPKTGLGWTGQDRTGQATARARFDRSSTHWPRNKRARVLAGLWI